MPHSTGTATFPRSGVLVLSDASISSLVPSTLISQVESLLESHRIEDTVDLADQQRKKIYGNLTVNEDEIEELNYVYQRIGFQCFSETLFEDAGKSFLEGNLDPRLLVSYFPDLRGSLFTADDFINVYAGVAVHMPPDASVDDLIAANLVRNYSPHLPPNTRSAPPTAELRKILGLAAHDMLELFLNKYRKKLQVDATSQPEEICAVVDTVLAKLLAQAEKTKELYTLFQEANHVAVSEIEPVLKQTGQYNALCMLYKHNKDEAKLLETWAKLVEGEWTDEDIQDPLNDMMTLLTEKKDRALIQHWAIWLTKIDPDRGLKLLTSANLAKRKDKGEEDVALLKQIIDANPAAGLQYLEHLVLQRRGSTEELHQRYAVSLVDQLISLTSDDSVSKLWRAKAASFASTRQDSTMSFFAYFTSTTPDSEHKRARIKTALFLQGSSLYDVQHIKAKIQPHSRLLKLELAIIEGKLKNHRDALSALIHDLHDSTSAEVYCTLGGHVIPCKVATATAESTPGLQGWVNAPFFPRSSGKVDDAVKRGLLKVLLEVYLAEEASSTRATRLLESQAVNLDIVEVMPLVPDEWSVNVMASFLERSFRRAVHERHEGQIVKAISEAQNMEVKDRTWLVLREDGMVIEDAAEDDDGEGEGVGDVIDEKSALQVTLGPPLVDDGYTHPDWDTVEAG